MDSTQEEIVAHAFTTQELRVKLDEYKVELDKDVDITDITNEPERVYPIPVLPNYLDWVGHILFNGKVYVLSLNRVFIQSLEGLDLVKSKKNQIEKEKV